MRYIHSGSQSKTIFKNSSLYFVISLLTKGSNLLLLPVMTRLLTPEDYGILSNIEAIIGFSAVFISLYLDSSFNRYFFDNNKTKSHLAEYISSFFWFIFLWGFFVTALIFIILYSYYDLSKIIFFPIILMICISPLIQQLGLIGQMFLRNRLETKMIVFPNFLFFIINTILSLYLLYFFEMGYVGRFIGIFTGFSLATIYYIIILIKAKFLVFKINFKIIKKGLIFSLPLIPLALSSWTTLLSDRLIITYYGSSAENGIYDVAYKGALLVRIFGESIFQVFGPMLTSMYTVSIIKFKESLTNFIPIFNWIVLSFAFSISLFAKEIVDLLVEDSFNQAYTLIPIIVFGYYISSHQKYLGSIFGLKEKNYLSTIGYFLAAFINLILNFLFIPILGSVAAAWTTFGSLLFLTLWCGYWFYKFEPIKISWKKIINTYIVFIVTYIVFLSLFPTVSSDSTVLNILIKSMIIFPLLIFGSIKLKVFNFQEIMSLSKLILKK